MEVLGPVVYAWLQYERLLEGVESATTLGASWHGANLSPRQLFVYLDVAFSDSGKRGAKLRVEGKTCRWAHP